MMARKRSIFVGSITEYAIAAALAVMMMTFSASSPISINSPPAVKIHGLCPYFNSKYQDNCRHSAGQPTDTSDRAAHH